MTEQPFPVAPLDPEVWERRFRFLHPSDPHGLHVCLYAPDILEPRWQLWDFKEKRTVCFGRTAEEAVDTGIEYAAKLQPKN